MGGYAWVTLATNDSYSLGALVLAHSLKQVGTQQQLAVLITPGVTNSMRAKLGEIFNIVKEVNILDSKDESNLRLLKRPELGITFTKLHCWCLTQFEKCVFLDADTLVLENCDELFEREELSAAPDIGWPDCFNSGVFVYRPSNDTYEKLIHFALEKGSFDGGDQGLLNLYFSDWAHKDISKHLPFIYNMASTACYSYLPAFKQYGKNAKILHFIGSSKPWLQYFNTETRKVHPSEGLQHLEQILQHWWNIFCNLIHPALTPDMAGLAGAFANLTLGQARTPEQQALDDHLRRQGWEVGNIDYLGRDSFDNIWSKICETLSITSEAESTPYVKENLTESLTKKEASPEKLTEPSPQKEAEKAKTVEQLQTSTVPEPDKIESTTTAPAYEDSPAESKEESRSEVTSETIIPIQPSDISTQETKSVADAPVAPEIQSLQETFVPTSAISDKSASPSKISPEVDDLTATESIKPENLSHDRTDDTKLAQSLGITEPSSEQLVVSKPLPESTPQPATIQTSQTDSEGPKITEEPTKTEHKDLQSSVTTPSDVQLQSPDSVTERPKELPPQETSNTASVEVLTETSQILSTEPLITSLIEPLKSTNQEPFEALLTDASKEIKETPRETPQAKPTEADKDTIAEITKTAPAAPVETPKPPATESSVVALTGTTENESTKIPKSTLPESSKATEAIAAPADTPKATPEEILKSVSTDTTQGELTETSIAVKTEIARDASAETPKDASVKTSTITETLKSAPTETSKEVPKKSDESVSKKGSKGKQTPDAKQVPKQATQVPVSKVVEPTPPTTPQTPQATEPVLPPLSKSELQVQSDVPNTPPAAAQEATSGPTPPPRKSATTPKKAAAKKK